MVKKRVIKKNLKQNYIYDNFLSSLRYLKEVKIYFIICIVLLLVSSLFGYFKAVDIISPTLSKTINNYIVESVEEIKQQTENLNSIDMTFFIITNNIKTAFVGVISGIFFAISPIIVLIFNGYVIGFVANAAVNSPYNTEGIFVLWRLLPHGIFELPAILISIGLGIKLGLYPLYLKEKSKGFISLILSFFIFFILSGIILTIMSVAISPEIINTGKMINETGILDNPFLSILFYLVLITCLIVSFLIGLKVLSPKDKNIFKEILKNSLRVFIFIIIPLLVVAGFIEGLLIYLVG
jgi:stage II sporulation protein M